MAKVIGQEHATAILRAALAGRMHHAWILHGPTGVGKCTAAIDVGRVLLCHDPRRDRDGVPEACGGCVSCRLFDSPDGAHPDLHMVTKELAQFSDDRATRERKLITIPVEIIREHLIGPAYRSAAMNHGKVFILNEAELLSDTGQNALLKTLEEPPAGTHIFLITSQLEGLLPTIRSRCQRVGFRALSDEQLGSWLASRPEGEALNARQRADVARFAQGSPGMSLLAIRYGLDEWVRTVLPLAERAAGGDAEAETELGPAMSDRCDAFAKAWVDAPDNRGASKDAANKRAVRLMLATLGGLCRSKLRELPARAGAGVELDAAIEPWLAAVELLDEAERELEANVAPPLLLDNLAVQWSQAAAARSA